MSILNKLVGSGVGSIATGVAGAIDRFVETAEEKKAAELLLIKVRQNPARWQTEINKIEAGHRNFFVAGARPFILWICGIGIALNFIIFPIGEWIAPLVGCDMLMPKINSGELMTLVLSLLGLSGMRSYEKKQGLTK